jgi:hypothetical protein
MDKQLIARLALSRYDVIRRVRASVISSTAREEKWSAGQHDRPLARRWL